MVLTLMRNLLIDGLPHQELIYRGFLLTELLRLGLSAPSAASSGSPSVTVPLSPFNAVLPSTPSLQANDYMIMPPGYEHR